MPYALVFIMPILIFLPISFAIVYHLQKYGLEGDKSKEMSKAFIFISAVLIILALFAFLRIDWARFGEFTFFNY